MLRPEEAQRPLSVSELAREIQRQLGPLSAVLVKGEVSGMRKSAKGHYSFTIRDSGAQVEAFLFLNDARKLPLLPEDGQELLFRGRVDFWPQGGRLRLIVDYVEFADAGKMRAQLELLKRRLEQEGAFEAGRKRRLPFLPRRVALVTSPTGAVIHDLQETILDRFPNMAIAVYPAQVQGTASPGSVARALRRCNADADADVVIIARGGGSFEELWAFNTEVVARAILASAVPVVTALGHTSDRTVADMVADAECRTPTEAGARVVPLKADLLRRLAERGRRIDREAALRMRRESERLAERDRRLRLALPAFLRRHQERLERYRNDIARLSPVHQLARRERALEDRRGRLRSAAGRAVRSAERALLERDRRLRALSPDAVLSRGYSITMDVESGAVLKAASQTARGRRVRVRLARGGLEALVEDAR
jgi:exodeoxyribonuclease VII large subunit